MPAYISFLTALSWSLLDSVWQMAVVWMAYYLLTAGNKRISAAGKHNLVLLFVFIGSEWFVYNFIQMLNEPTRAFDPGFISLSPSAGRWIPYLGLIYLLTLLTRFFQSGFQYANRRKNLSGHSILPALQLFAERHARLLGIPRQVHVYLSGLAETAEISGFFKPVILLPVSLLTRLTPLQVEAILVHELFHIRRNDYLINICMSCFRSIFFFNPFAHLFYKALARQRELACDDGVVEKGFEPALYAEALFSLEKFRQPQPGFSLAADGHRPWLLMERIRRLLGEPDLPKNRFNPLLIISLFLAFGLFSLQQNHPRVPEVTPPAAKPVAFIPARYEITQKGIERPGWETVAKPAVNPKPVKKQKQMPQMQDPETEPAEETGPANQVVFAENNIDQNFSNDQTAALNQDPVHEMPGTPYVSSGSFSYEPQPVIIAEDSIRNIVIQNGLQELAQLNRLKTIAGLKELEIEMDKNKRQLKEIEIKNRELILLNQHNIKPLLDRMQRQIELKKQKIDRLRIRLQISEEEIIHI